MKTRIGPTARTLRALRGLTQREAARELGISPVHLCRIEHDQSLPSFDLLERYREVFGMDPYVLEWCLGTDGRSLQDLARIFRKRIPGAKPRKKPGQ